MSTDTDTHDDAFEADLAARLGAATDRVTADGVTREGIDQRVAARQASRRRRQGGIVLAAAALVIAAGIGALALGSDEPSTTVKADQGGTTEAPTTTTTDRPTTTEAPVTPTTDVFPDGCPPPSTAAGVAGSCVGTETTTTPPPPETTTTTTAPPTTTTPSTEPPTTTGPVRPAVSPTALEFVRGVIAGRDVSSVVEPGFDPVSDMRSELPEDLTGFVANPVERFDWDAWSGSTANPRPNDPSCADVGDSSVVCIVSVARSDYSLFLHVYMTGNGPTRVAAVDSDA